MRRRPRPRGSRSLARSGVRREPSERWLIAPPARRLSGGPSRPTGRRGRRDGRTAPRRPPRWRTVPGGTPRDDSPRCTDSHAAQSWRFVRSQKSTAKDGSKPGTAMVSGANSHWHSTTVRRARRVPCGASSRSRGAGSRACSAAGRCSRSAGVATPCSRRSGVVGDPPQRHRDRVRHEVLPPADPEAVVPEVVLAARRRADLAQLGVDVRAVEALLVVLDDELPVRRQLVGVRGADDEPLGLVVGDVAAPRRRGTRRTARRRRWR